MQLQERILQLMKNSSDTLSLTYKEFSHIRNVLTRAELENLLFNEKLYTEVAYGKLCFTCRKVHLMKDVYINGRIINGKLFSLENNLKVDNCKKNCFFRFYYDFLKYLTLFAIIQPQSPFYDY
ncbi:unnamed protein product [Rotaria sp. Silwood2]|nr:unnamed protein product [Rotaria sp. Silwood2]